MNRKITRLISVCIGMAFCAVLMIGQKRNAAVEIRNGEQVRMQENKMHETKQPLFVEPNTVWLQPNCIEIVKDSVPQATKVPTDTVVAYISRRFVIPNGVSHDSARNMLSHTRKNNIQPAVMKSGVTDTVSIPSMKVFVDVFYYETKDSTNLSIIDKYYAGERNDSIATFNISNTGSRNLKWRIKHKCKWIEITPQRGITKVHESTSVSIKIDRSKLTNNEDYSYSFIVTSSGGRAEVDINVEYYVK
jgi:hypothetical protein